MTEAIQLAPFEDVAPMHAPELAAKTKTAAVEAVENLTYGSVSSSPSLVASLAGSY